MFHFSWRICLNQKNWIPNVNLVLQLKFQNWLIFEAARSNVAVRFSLFFVLFYSKKENNNKIEINNEWECQESE
jgi:hypothetical protein